MSKTRAVPTVPRLNMRAGEGKARDAAIKPTVYKRAVDRTYILKSQLGRHFMSEVQNSKRYGALLAFPRFLFYKHRRRAEIG